jgi:hypothetical protein
MAVIRIVWQRLVSDQRTCPRCGSTGAEIEAALAVLKPALEPRGIVLILEKKEITPEQFQENPLESNRIFINDRPIEHWLNAGSGQSPCCDVCGSAQCRTIKLTDRHYEAIPAELIIQAVLTAARQFTSGNA